MTLVIVLKVGNPMMGAIVCGCENPSMRGSMVAAATVVLGLGRELLAPVNSYQQPLMISSKHILCHVSLLTMRLII
jgi:hypothetical protein